MIEKAQLLQAGFSVADAEYPSFSLRDNNLSLDFTDWNGQSVRVSFSNAAGVKWQELDTEGSDDRDDSIYEIVESEWIKQYLTQKTRTELDRLRHFKLCYNGHGVLEVLASEMMLLEAG